MIYLTLAQDKTTRYQDGHRDMFWMPINLSEAQAASMSGVELFDGTFFEARAEAIRRNAELGMTQMVGETGDHYCKADIHEVVRSGGRRGPAIMEAAGYDPMGNLLMENN